MSMISTLLLATISAAPTEAAVQELFVDGCDMCHSAGGDPGDPEGLDLSVSPSALIGLKSVVNGKPFIVPGDPDASYLLTKMIPDAAMEGELMPPDDPLPAEQLALVREWIASLPPPEAVVTEPDTPDTETPDDTTPIVKRSPKPFHGTTQIVLPSTTTLGKLNLQYRIDHRFGRIGTERGAFGMDGGATMSFGLAYGIYDGWDVQVRRTNSHKGWELGTKYVPIRQEEGKPLSFGGVVSMDWFREFDGANPIAGNFMLMLSRLWFERWSTMLTASYHLRTNHASRVFVDPEDGGDPVQVRDTRGSVDIGVASTIWLGARRRWGVDLEYVQPVPDGGRPNALYYRGGDADTEGPKIGAWGLGGSYSTGRHIFQLFFTNNREIHPNLYAPGGQTGNPFKTEGVDSKNPFHDMNFFLGFNLGRKFSLAPAAKRGAKRRTARKEGK